MVKGAFTLTSNASTQASGSSSVQAGQIVYGPEGIIDQYGEYIQTKNNTSNGLVTFFPTSDGTVNGTPIFEEILAVRTEVIFQGSDPRQPVTSVHQVVQNTSIVVKTIRGTVDYNAPGSSNKTMAAFTNLTAQIQITVSGRLKLEYFAVNLQSPTVIDRFSLTPTADKVPVAYNNSKIDTGWISTSQVLSAEGQRRGTYTIADGASNNVYTWNAKTVKVLIQALATDGRIDSNEMLLVADGAMARMRETITAGPTSAPLVSYDTSYNSSGLTLIATNESGQNVTLTWHSIAL